MLAAWGTSSGRYSLPRYNLTKSIVTSDEFVRRSIVRLEGYTPARIPPAGRSHRFGSDNTQPILRKNGLEEGIPDIAFAMVGSVISYELSTSIWARFALNSRVPGVPAESFSRGIFLVLSDHPVACAALSGALCCMSLRLLRRAINGRRQGNRAV